MVLLSCASCEKISLGEKAVDSATWVSAIPDDVTVASLSIPGAHDAATFTMNTPIISSFAKTQAMSISEQLERGVRAFDLRPALVDGKLKICHDKYDTNVSFADAVNAIVGFLDRNPSEFAIVLIRHEVEADNNTNDWNTEFYNYLSSVPDNRIIKTFNPLLKVKDMRGRILFLSRNEYADEPIGGYVHNWYSGTDIERQKSASIEETPLWVQDYYDPEGMDDKLSAVRNLLVDFAANSEPGIWCFNHTSGYTPGIFGAPDYGENASNINSKTAEIIESLSGSTGIVMMDFAGASKYKSYNVYGDKLLVSIINHNFPDSPHRVALHTR